MKRFLFASIACSLLLLGCNNSNNKNGETYLPSSELLRFLPNPPPSPLTCPTRLKSPPRPIAFGGIIGIYFIFHPPVLLQPPVVLQPPVASPAFHKAQP